MTFKTSLFKKGLIISDLKRFWWISVLYTLILFFILPLYHMMQETPIRDEGRKVALQNSLRYLSDRNDFQKMLILIVPVVLAVLLFRYMQTSRSAAMAHSLPCSRKTLFCSHNAAGLILLTIPVILTGLVLMVLQTTTDLREIYSLPDVLQWIGFTLLFDVLFFAVAVFVGMFTGSSIAQIVFTYILHVLPAGVYTLLKYNLGHLIYGYNSSMLYENTVDNLPIFVLLNQRHNSEYFSKWHIAVYILLTVVLFAAALYVYRIRKLEAASDIIAFSVFRPVFKYGVAVCGMLLGGTYFASISNGSFYMVVLGYVVSSFLGYWLSEVLIHKSFKVWHAYKGYLSFTAVLLVVVIGIVTDATGYISRIPEPDKVEKVYFGYNIAEWDQFEKIKDEKLNDTKYINSYFFESKENIKNIINLHHQLIQKPYNKKGSIRYIIYTLKNGKYLIRQYYLEEKQYASLLKPIYESLEYKRARFPVITQKAEEIKFIELKDTRTPKNPVILSTNTEIREFTELLQKEVSGLAFEELTSQAATYMNINIMGLDRKSQQYAFRENYASIFRWLKDKGYYEKVMLLPDEVEYVTLGKSEFTKYGAQVSSQKSVEIMDAKLIQELFRIYSQFDYNRKEQYVQIWFNVKGYPRYFHFEGFLYNDTPVSEELRGYLKKLDN